MIPLNITKTHVLKAIKEIDKNGIPKERESTKYYLVYKDKYYPPKYVISVANKYSNGKELDAGFFHGGQETNDYLSKMEFTIVNYKETNYVIITENDESAWSDTTGVLYHFPNKYKKYLQPGTHVIYYKGVLKKKEYSKTRLTDSAHYFGFGKIGEVIKDKNSSKEDYFAQIVDYIPFTRPVLNKQENGEYYEIIPLNKVTNYWRDGLRPISKNLFLKILDDSKLDYKVETNKISIKIHGKDMPDLDEVKAEVVDNVLLKSVKQKQSSSTSSNSKKTGNFSKNSKSIGDRAEEVILKHLNEILNDVEKASLDWLAQRNETPGYDITYNDLNGKEVCIEVKGTTAKCFDSFVITANEWLAASEKLDCYWIFLVTECMSKFPKIQKLNNPYMKQKTELELEPLSYIVKRK